jgi:SAM-dependent methyltransferase
VPGASVFGRDYAAAYDNLYRDKDYLAECDLIEWVCKTYATGPVRRVLDLGCGTGGHAVVLAEREYLVVGVDRSPEMLERARARGSSARFEQGQIASVDLGETFDAVLMMFAVLGYQVGNADVQAALARRVGTYGRADSSCATSGTGQPVWRSGQLHASKSSSRRRVN